MVIDGPPYVHPSGIRFEEAIIPASIFARRTRRCGIGEFSGPWPRIVPRFDACHIKPQLRELLARFGDHIGRAVQAHDGGIWKACCKYLGGIAGAATKIHGRMRICGRARQLPAPGAEHVLYLRTLDDARRLRPRLRPGARIVCIGAGVIGLEIASSAVARGCTVTVIEPGFQAMGRSLVPELAAWLATWHRENGVSLRFGIGVREITAGSVLCSDGMHIEADVVVAGIGIERNTELAIAAGLAVENGIIVDAFGRTSAPGIYAAGDVAAFWAPRLERRMRLETWRHAQDHGTAIGRVIAGQGMPYDEIPWFWTDQHGINLQMLGTVEDAATTIMRGTLGVAPFSAWHLNAAGALIDVTAINAPRDIRAGQKLIRQGQNADPILLADTSVPAAVLVMSGTFDRTLKV